jgi:membrane associated rhomboid family serine protease
MEEEEKNKIAESVLYPFLFVALLWAIKLVEHYSETSLARLGILPRTLNGFLGITTAPLIHGDIYHLGSNTLPLLILGIIIMYFYNITAPALFIWVYVFTGAMVWMFADGSGYHLGASGIIYGLVSFLFFSGIIRKDRRSMALALLVTFVYGGMVWGVFPLYKGVSWESHLFGAIGGAFCAWYYKDLDPAPKEVYDWEMEEETQEQIPDQTESNPLPNSLPTFQFVYTDTSDRLYSNSPECINTPPQIKYVYIRKKAEKKIPPGQLKFLKEKDTSKPLGSDS